MYILGKKREEAEEKAAAKNAIQLKQLAAAKQHRGGGDDVDLKERCALYHCTGMMY